MDSLYKSYIRAFEKYAETALQNKQILTISQYALMINSRANQLLQRATLNMLVDLPLLEKALFEAGKGYIHKFITRLKREKTIFNES